jgi:hypothetical protein
MKPSPTLRLLAKQNPIAAAVLGVEPQRVPRVPVQLRPVPFGQPDPALARGLCQHLADATPPTVIRFNPLTNGRLRRVLRSFGIHV